VTAPHPDSVAPRPAGGSVTLKVHRAIWSGALPANSLAAIAECCAAGVARAEIDIQPRRDGGFVVFHDDRLDRSTDARGAVRDLGDALAAIAAAPYPTVFELDLKELEPWPWPRVEAFVRLLEPVRDRVLLGTEADWNLRRILTVDPAIPVSLNPGAYLDWTAGEGHAALPRGAYGYFDRHPLASRRSGPVRDYLADRFGSPARAPDVQLDEIGAEALGEREGGDGVLRREGRRAAMPEDAHRIARTTQVGARYYARGASQDRKDSKP